MILPEDHADGDQTITDEDEIWLEDDRQATPSDAEEDLENDLSEETKATASNANLRDSHFYCQTMVDDVTITIEAESGILPMGTVAEIEEVEYAGQAANQGSIRGVSGIFRSADPSGVCFRHIPMV